MEAPQRLFDLPHRLAAEDARELLEDLRYRWQLQYGTGPDDVADDLARMRRHLFDPVSREERLRRELAALDPGLGRPPPYDSATMFLRTPEEKWIVTPEGRVAIPCLDRALASRSQETIYIDELDIHAAEHVLADTYRDWTRYRLNRVISLQHGDERAMLPAAIATVLFLLINGNVGQGRAMIQPKSEREQRLLDEAVTRPVVEFTKRIESDRVIRGRPDQHLKLYNGYGLSEARRRFGANLVLEKAPGSPDAKQLYVVSEAEDDVIKTLARELRRRAIESSRAAEAFDAMSESYELSRPDIAAYAQVFAAPSRTREIRDALLTEL